MSDKSVDTDVDVADAFAKNEVVRTMEQRFPEVLEDPAIQQLSEFLQDTQGASEEQVQAYIKGLYMGGEERIPLDDIGTQADALDGEEQFASVDIT